MFDSWINLLLLYLLGLALVLVEVFVPSGGILGIASALCIGFSLWHLFSVNAWVASICVAFTVIYVVVSFRWGMRRLRMDANLATGVATGADVKEASEHLVGSTGEAITALRPAGVALIEGRRYDVVTQGGFVEVGQGVKVLAADGNRIQVKGT